MFLSLILSYFLMKKKKKQNFFKKQTIHILSKTDYFNERRFTGSQKRYVRILSGFLGYESDKDFSLNTSLSHSIKYTVLYRFQFSVNLLNFLKYIASKTYVNTYPVDNFFSSYIYQRYTCCKSIFINVAIWRNDNFLTLRYSLTFRIFGIFSFFGLIIFFILSHLSTNSYCQFPRNLKSLPSM